MTDIEMQIVDELMKTGREGIDQLVEWMKDNGFFIAPCSGAHHLAQIGGLAEHSLNVFIIMQKLNRVLDAGYSDDTIAVCAILHDLGKCGDHGKPNYVPNIIKDGRPTKAEPEQKYKQSETKPYKTNTELIYVDHEIRSIKIAGRFIDLTEEEEQAILYHNGLYGTFRYQIQGKETPLYLLLHTADMWASRVVEKGEDDEEI